MSPTAPTSNRLRLPTSKEILRVEAESLDPAKGKFAVLPTVGGQTALNLAVDLADAGVLDRLGIELIGAKLEAIKKAEDRLLFKDAMNKIGLDMPKSMLVNNIRDGLEFAVRSSASRLSSAPASRLAAPAEASPSTAKS